MSVYTIHPSRRLKALNLGLHAMGFLALGLADVGTWPRLAGFALLAAGAAHALRPSAAVWLHCADDGGLSVELGEARWEAELQAGTVVLPWLCLLKLYPLGGGRCRNIIVLPDSLPAEAFRRLRVWLGSKGRIR